MQESDEPSATSTGEANIVKILTNALIAKDSTGQRSSPSLNCPTSYCTNCRRNGHLTRDCYQECQGSSCPNQRQGYSQLLASCHYCNYHDHLERDCYHKMMN